MKREQGDHPALFILITVVILNFPHIVGRSLIDVIIEPVGEEKLPGGPPVDDGVSRGVILREVIHRNLWIHSFFQVTRILERQRVCVILQMAGDEEMAAVLGFGDGNACLVGDSHQLQTGHRGNL